MKSHRPRPPVKLDRPQEQALRDRGISNSQMQEALAAKQAAETKATDVAQAGVRGSGQEVPHKDQLEGAFGRDLSGVEAHVGGEAGDAAQALGAEAYATGNQIAFAEHPNLWLAAHEVAHALDDREPAGGMSASASDPLEQTADAAADRAVDGDSASGLVPDSGSADRTRGVSLYSTTRIRGRSARVGEHGEAVVMEGYGQEMYATQARIDEANSKLSQAGRDGSFIELEASRGIEHEGKDLKKVMPQWVDKGAAAGQHAGLNEPNDGGADTEGRTGGPMALWSDCGRSSQAVTGSQGGDRSAVYFEDGEKQTTRRGMDDSSVSGWLKTGPGRMANKIYYDLVPKFIEKPENEKYLTEGVHYERVSRGGIIGWILDFYDKPTETIEYTQPTDIVDAKRLYAELSDDGRDKFDQQAGINHYANPEIGESYTMATEGDMPGFEVKDGYNAWNFHWGGVIMKDGSDNVTLENYAVNREYAESKGVAQRDFINRSWNYDMLGTEDESQTFHKAHLDTHTHGSHASTLRVRTDK